MGATSCDTRGCVLRVADVTFRGGVLAAGPGLVTGCTLFAGVLAEGLLLASAGDTFLGGVLAEGL